MNDADLLNKILGLIVTRAAGNPYSADDAFARNLAGLPPGLRAMAATHCLDVSLSVDDRITWHFGTFRGPQLAAETEAGLIELGLEELAAYFREARELMIPILPEMTLEDDQACDVLYRKGLFHQGNELDARARAWTGVWLANSPIHEAWIRYARQYPERVFGV